MLWIDPTALGAAASAPGHILSNVEDWWRVWNIEPFFLVPALAGVALYTRGLWRWRVRSRAHPWWRSALFYLGMFTLFAAVNSPLHVLSERHFSSHMVQHLLVMTVGVPLILLGAPTTPVLRGLPRLVRRNVFAPLASDPIVRRVFGWVTHPMTALVVSSVVLIAWHAVPGWYDLAAAHAGVHEVQHLSFLITSGLFWWNVIDPAPLHARLGYLLRIVYVIAQGTVSAVLAAFISLADRPLYEFYVHATPVFPISVMDDQQLGGLLMWIPGQTIDLVVIGVLFGVWWQQMERRQREADERGAVEVTSDRYRAH